MKLFNCDYCKKSGYKETGHYNRSKKLGLGLFCSRKCSGLAKRVYRTVTQKKEIKRIYDKEYRLKNRDMLKKKKAIFFKKDYSSNPEKYRKIRKLRSKAHSEYCRQPAYKAKKHKYDRARYAKKAFGPLWEAHVLSMEIQEESQKLMSKYEMKLKRGTYNKAQFRRRKYAKTKRSEFEESTMGNFN